MGEKQYTHEEFENARRFLEGISILQDNGLDKDDADAVTEAFWDLFDLPIPDSDILRITEELM